MQRGGNLSRDSEGITDEERRELWREEEGGMEGWRERERLWQNK